MTISLRSVEQTGGGAKVTLTLGEASLETAEKIKTDAERAQQSQLALRGKEEEILELRSSLRATERAFDRLLDKMSESRKQEITVHGDVRGVLQIADHASADLHGAVFNDNSELIQLIDKLLTAHLESSLPESDNHRLTAAAETAKAELQKPHPDKSVLARSLDFFKTLPKEAVLKGVGKLGEKAVDADWSSLLHQLSAFISHLR